MPYDPTVTAIAVATNDALTDHVWRHDTADNDDPVADVARALCQAANEFNATTRTLSRTLIRLAEDCAQHLTSVTDLAAFPPSSLDLDAFALPQGLERYTMQREATLSLYRLWRRHRPASRDPRVRHLLVQPYDPRQGMVTLVVADESGLAWQVTPDPVAVEAHGVRGHGPLVGDIQLGDTGWQATAYTHAGHRTESPDLVVPLLVADTEATACRALLRWWALRDSEHLQGRTPAQLTEAERNALTA